ncbi:MAG TPA: hypothetical protein VGE11_16140 [Pseudonocardia sp.]
MRTTLHTAALLAAVALLTASAQPAMAATPATTDAATSDAAAGDAAATDATDADVADAATEAADAATDVADAADAATDLAATWSPPLTGGSGAGVAVVDGAARIDPRTAFLAPPEPTQPESPQPESTQPGPTQPGPIQPGPTQPGPTQPGPSHIDPAQPQAPHGPNGRSRAVGTPPSPAGHGAAGGAEGGADATARTAPGGAVATGLLTLPEHRLAAATDHVAVSVAAQQGAGGDAAVDVRGLRASGNWSEWITADAHGVAVLPESSTQVQARLVLTGDPGPVVTGLTLKAAASSQKEGTKAVGALTYSVYATREGLLGGTTANGHVIAPHDHFVALPSRRALSPDGKSDYSVRVCAANGRCVFAPVWDVGPWNTHDDYWNPAARREQWTDLPQGMPEAQAAFRKSYNGGNDQYKRHVVNPAGIDLGDGVFWDDLGLVTNSTVTVTYLWTGDVRLAKVVDTGPVLASPKQDAKVVGIAADNAGVPAECTVGDWLRIGIGQYLAASAVSGLGHVGVCTDAGVGGNDQQ